MKSEASEGEEGDDRKPTTTMWKWKECYPNYNLQNGTSKIDFKPFVDNKTKVVLGFSANGKVVKSNIYTEIDLSLSTAALSPVLNVSRTTILNPMPRCTETPLNLRCA